MRVIRLFKYFLNTMAEFIVAARQGKQRYPRGS